jgi:hypothetical protein
MQAIGNRVANQYWEKKLPADFERPDLANRSLLQTFIRQKYVFSKWADFGPPPHKIFEAMPPPPHKRRRSVPKSKPKPKPPPVVQFTLDDFFTEQSVGRVPQPIVPHQRTPIILPEAEPRTVEEIDALVNEFFRVEPGIVPMDDDEEVGEVMGQKSPEEVEIDQLIGEFFGDLQKEEKEEKEERKRNKRAEEKIESPQKKSGVVLPLRLKRKLESEGKMKQRSHRHHHGKDGSFVG